VFHRERIEVVSQLKIRCKACTDIMQIPSAIKVISPVRLIGELPSKRHRAAILRSARSRGGTRWPEVQRVDESAAQ
jgi:hypothetical protein